MKTFCRYASAAAILLLMVVACMSCAKAAVIVCADTACKTRQSKELAALAPDDLVLFCSSGAADGSPESACASSQPYRWGGMQSYSVTLTDTGWHRRDSIPATTGPPSSPWKYEQPDCFPKSFDELRFSISGAKLRLLWYCDTPRAIVKISRAYTLTNFAVTAAAALNIMSHDYGELVTLDRAPLNRALTDEERADIDSLEAAQGISLRVSKNGFSSTRPVYSANQDATRGENTGKRIAVGAPCSRRDRLVDDKGRGSDYFAVNGGYAVCDVIGAVSK